MRYSLLLKQFGKRIRGLGKVNCEKQNTKLNQLFIEQLQLGFGFWVFTQLTLPQASELFFEISRSRA